jgi:predicted nucleotidyltransferase component of viral defense system
MREPVRNMGASVRARLLNLAKERRQPHELLLTRYALERLLYRLSASKHRERFVLKGAMLMTAWLGDPFRPTRDLDLLSPVLLDLPAPRLRAYLRETVVAEKFQAMVALGRANSRMKDFYDVWALVGTYEFTGDRLARAIAAADARAASGAEVARGAPR